MKRTNVVIASVLKPVDDTRMYEKIARSLASIPGLQVHIIGFQSAQLPPPEANITFHPLFNFPRLSAKRFIASLKYYKKLLEVKPKIIIPNTTDLLIVTCFYKIIFGAEILYDVQENYLYNSLYTEKFRRPLNFMIGYFLRGIEWMSAPFIRHFILAEQTYKQELPFIGNRFTVIENKFQPPVNIIHQDRHSFNKKSVYHLLYSGTIAESYGIFDAIDLAVKLHQVDSRFYLTIIGYCADTNVFAKILDKTRPHPFIRIVGGDRLVSHAAIINAIQQADIGLIAYQFNKSTVNRIPTKLNEYMYYRLPLLLPDNALWVSYCGIYQAYIKINYNDVDPYRLIGDLLTASFYDSSGDSSLLLWDIEKSKLVSLVKLIITTIISN